MTERIVSIEDQTIPEDYVKYGGVEFPRYLITRARYETRMQEVRHMMLEFSSELAEGTPGGDAGDTHGQYHNELAWYREQNLSMKANIIEKSSEGLDRAVVIESYDQIKEIIKKTLTYDENIVTLTSSITIQYGDDPEDIEKFMLVAPLDSDKNRGFISVESPLAKAIEGKRKGESSWFKLGSNVINIKILID